MPRLTYRLLDAGDTDHSVWAGFYDGSNGSLGINSATQDCIYSRLAINGPDDYGSTYDNAFIQGNLQKWSVAGT